MLRGSEIYLAQRAPVEAYVNTYLRMTVIAYKVDQTGVHAVRCEESEIVDLENMVCKNSNVLAAYGTTVTQCAYFQLDNECVDNCIKRGYLNPVSSKFAADNDQHCIRRFSDKASI